MTVDDAAVGSRHALTLQRELQREPEWQPRVEVVQPAAPKLLIPDHLLPAGDRSQYEVLSENRILWLKDGKEMVLIPAGKFLYGEDKQELELPAFWMDKTPVTNEEYKRFLDANPNYYVPFRDETWAKNYNWDKQVRHYPQGKGTHPRVLVNWHDAQAYAEWTEKVMPTEQQWEKAARGTDGLIYPWGNKWADKNCNSGWRVGSTSPVGQFSPQGDSPFGCVDMSGNVWEWTDSWRDAGEGARVLRGVSWGDFNNFARADYHLDFHPHVRNYYVGFRVCSPIISDS